MIEFVNFAALYTNLKAPSLNVIKLIQVLLPPTPTLLLSEFLMHYSTCR